MRTYRMAGVEIPREAFGGAWWHLVAHMRRFVRIRVDVSSIWPFMIPRGERGTGIEHPSQLGTKRQWISLSVRKLFWNLRKIVDLDCEASIRTVVVPCALCRESWNSLWLDFVLGSVGCAFDTS